MHRPLPGPWPKKIPTLTEEQQRVHAEFYQIWLEELPKRHGVLERFNHGYPLRTVRDQIQKTLDIGAGRGEHLAYESLESQHYFALELRPELAGPINASYPEAKVVIGDIQQHVDFPDGYFDRIMAIHVLEHLPDLPRALDEIRRLLNKTGLFAVLIPCAPGLAYEMGRNLSARRIFEQRFKQSYDWFINCEHINSPHEIIAELEPRFLVVDKTFFPLRIPLVDLNLVIGLTLTHLK